MTAKVALPTRIARSLNWTNNKLAQGISLTRHGYRNRAVKTHRQDWTNLVLLIALSLVPILAGMHRLARLAGSGTAPKGDLRFFLAPMPVTLHILAATLYCVLGALQFHKPLRLAHPQRHRRLGWISTVAGYLMAATAIWMTLSYPIPIEMQGGLLMVVRMAVATAMAAFLTRGLMAIIGGNVRMHRAWMMRAYALALGAGTQVLLFIPPAIFVGEILGLPRDLLLTAGWLLNLLVAEYLIANRDGVTRSVPR